MGLISACGALGLGMRVDMQYGTRRLFPRDALRIGVEKADVRNQMQAIIIGKLIFRRCHVEDRRVYPRLGQSLVPLACWPDLLK